jgi:hypothetical protein
MIGKQSDSTIPNDFPHKKGGIDTHQFIKWFMALLYQHQLPSGKQT